MQNYGYSCPLGYRFPCPRKYRHLLGVDEQWSWQQFQDADATSVALANSVNHTVHVLANFLKIRHIPLQGAITYFNNGISNKPSNRGHVIVVTQHRALKAMDPILRLLNPKAMETVHGFESLDEAYDLLMTLS